MGYLNDYFESAVVGARSLRTYQDIKSRNFSQTLDFASEIKLDV